MIDVVPCGEVECLFGASMIMVGLSETNYSFFLRKSCIFVAIKNRRPCKMNQNKVMYIS